MALLGHIEETRKTVNIPIYNLNLHKEVISPELSNVIFGS